MNIKYDVEKIKAIISDFSNITGVSMSLLDTEFNWIATYEHNNPEFCKRIRSYPQGDLLCYHSDMDLLKKCHKTTGFVTHVCHAGIVDSAMPIMKNGIISGYIIFGRIRRSVDIEAIHKNVEWLGESAESLKDSYMKIAYYNDEQIKSMSRLVSEILFVNAIEVNFDEPLKSAVEYIDDNLGGDLSLETLCKICHVSKNMLYKCFRDTFGTTINEYITEKRLEIVKYQLENTDKPIREIAESVGIDNYTYFCKMFKKNSTVSPSAYRRDIRKK